MSEPIEDGGEVNEADEGFGEFVVTGGDAALDFDAAEEVFDLMAAAVVAAMKSDRLTASAFGWNAATGPLLAQFLAKDISVESLVGDNPVSAGTG